MNKKSQVLIFGLLGLILLLGTSFVFYLKSENSAVESQKNTVLPLAANPIKSYIQNCIEATGKNALIFIGKRGGYYELKMPYLKDENFSLPYYVADGLDFSPLIKTIEKELSKYINENLNLCTRDLDIFEQQGYVVARGIVNSSVSIGQNTIYVNIDFPVSITKGQNTQNFQKFSTIFPDFNLQSIHQVSKEIVNQQVQKPNSICLSCLYDLATDRKLFIDIAKYNDDSIIFFIKDYNFSEDNIIKKPYNYTFAISLLNISCNNIIRSDDSVFIKKCVDEKITNLTKVIEIDEIPDFRLKINQPFIYDVKAQGKGLFFSSYSELFDISSNGTIDFTPNSEQIGNHTAWISAKDALGNEKFKNFIIEVIE